MNSFERQPGRRIENLIKKNSILRAILNAAPVGIGFSKNRIIEWTNKKFCEMVGYSKEEIFGKNSRFLYPNEEEYVRVGKEKYDKVEKYGIGSIETQFRRKDGTVIDVLLSSSAVNPGDLSEGVIFTVMDITEKKKIEREFRMNLKYFQDLCNLLPEGVFETNLNGKFTFVNKKALEMFGFSMADFERGLYAEQLLTEEDRERWRNNFKLILNGEKLGFVEYTALKKDGTVFPVEVHSLPIVRGGKTVGLRGIMIDITERKRAEEELKKRLMKFRLEEGKVYLVKEFTPMVSVEAFKDLLKIGYKGVIISRVPMEEFELSDGEFNYYWLAEKGDNCLIPDIKKIEEVLMRFPRKSAVLIDRLDYLIFKNGFKNTLFFVQHLRELAYLRRHIIILSIDPKTIEERDMWLLEKESSEIEYVHPKLHRNAYNILKYIYRRNLMGAKPTYSEVSSDLGLSRQTVYKWMKFLILKGYINEEVKGKSKHVELTDKGKNLFS